MSAESSNPPSSTIREYEITTHEDSPHRMERLWAPSEFGEPDGEFVALIDSGDQVFMWARVHNGIVHFGDGDASLNEVL